MKRLIIAILLVAGAALLAAQLWGMFYLPDPDLRTQRPNAGGTR